MFKTLTFEVVFASTGQALSGSYNFEPGLTAITGPNESGKSTVLEMLRYSLFGTRALRASSDQYTKLTVACSFTIAGVDYSISRKASTTKLWRGQELIATAAKAVNGKIVELLGYDLDVFDVVNNCAQSEVERLSSAKPSQRKALIEQTVGMEAIDTVIDSVKEKVSGLAGQVAGLLSGLREPGPQPVEPQVGHENNLRFLLGALEKAVQEAATLRGRLSAPPPVARNPPAAPTPPRVSLRRDEIQASLTEQQRLAGALGAAHRGLASTVAPSLTEIDCAALEAEAESLEANFSAASAQHRRWLEKIRLESFGSIKCPACQTEFPHEHKELESYNDLTDPVECPVSPAAWVRQLRQSAAAARAQLGNDAVRVRLQEEIRDLQLEMARLKPVGVLNSMLEELMRYDAAVRAFEQAQIAYEADLARMTDDHRSREAATARLAELGDAERDCGAVRGELQQRLDYNRAALDWEVANTSYEAFKADAERLADEADKWSAALAALKDLKVRIKSHLVPSLSAIASSYINRMTAGVRSSVNIDEDFNIFVDNQPIETLSGSGKAVANIAIRIALGLVLSAKNFSVFMGDEIDAFMDEIRAGSTAEALRNLSGLISQIIIVSHKPTEADHKIEL